MLPSDEPSRGLPWFRWVAGCLLILLLAGLNPAPAADPPPAKDSAVKTPDTKDHKVTPARGPQLPPVRRVEFFSAVFLWFAVVAVGLASVAMVVVLGRRLRRTIRRPRPTPMVLDPFWYLKKTPTGVTSGRSPDPLKRDETGQQPEGRPGP